MARKLSLSSIKSLVNKKGNVKISLKLPKSKYKSKQVKLGFKPRRIKV